ncbi:DUF5695 domain-containing protein [Paenibacillus nasutitermitis]|uniref:Uncharacterized protein n=1 Tax=Paenibacillus nasutitermitis TaxID=1652958 RepID=A0A917DLU2_9BACL|nr:DUF5695 domain-containing protein [Paenibacillus nasutitermitis]GGD46919.1 hypothetical protein GCM10010911_00520 [Paenibacillus nasutitermitis]
MIANTTGIGMELRLNSESGEIVYIGYEGDVFRENYIAGPVELPLIGTGAANKVEGYGAILLGYRLVGDETYRRQWLACSRKPGNEHAFVFDNEHVQVVKTYIKEAQTLTVNIAITAKGDAIELAELALSAPVNNYYCPWRYDQRYLYNHKVYEHIHPGGEHGYQLVERLNGTEPLLYCIPLANTRFEHTAHYPGTIDVQRPSIANHSWPGSSLLFLHAQGYLENSGYEPLIADSLVSSTALEAGETASYGLELGFIDKRQRLEEVLVSRDKISVMAVPAMTGPIDETFEIIAKGRGPLSLLDDGNIELISGREWAGGHTWKLKFRGTGKQLVRVAGEGAEPAVLLFRITDPLRDLLERRTDFILDKQVYREAGSVLDGAIVPYTIGDFDEFKGEGLCAKAESLWGNGSYEGGITDAMFAAEKNAILPDSRQIAELERYIVTYVRTFLQSPENNEVIWWFGDYSASRSYEYMHVANLYYSMYRIARLYGLTTRFTAEQYLTFAFHTLMKMYDVSRPMDLITGMMGGQRIFAILQGFQQEEMVEFYYTLLMKVRHHAGLLFQGDVPYGSECAYDNTGYECVAYYAQYFNETRCMEEITAVMLAVRGDQPVWWWQGSDIRWWDAGTDYAETCHHYTSPLNSSALLMFVRQGRLKPGPRVLALIYGGLLGSTAKIHEDGRASMSYCREQESPNYGDHVCTGDGGLSLYGTLLGLRSFAYASPVHGEIGYLGDFTTDGSDTQLSFVPLDVAGRQVSWYFAEEEGDADAGDADCSTGMIRQIDFDRQTGGLRLIVSHSAVTSPIGEIRLRLEGKLLAGRVNGSAARLQPAAEREYTLTYDVGSGQDEVVIEIERSR